MYLLRQLKSNLYYAQANWYYELITIRNMSGIKPKATSLDLLKEPGAAKRIVWIDMEMTGLDIDKDKIMEIACLVTDADLNVVATGPDIVIHQPEEVLNTMHPWCIAQHGESGLTKSCKNSKVSLQQAEAEVLEFVKNYVPEKKCPMAGNSIYMDRMFIIKYMPSFNAHLHYRNIDVSTIKELARRWHQKEFANQPHKQFKHRSINDIMESIEELKFYKQNIFK